MTNEELKERREALEEAIRGTLAKCTDGEAAFSFLCSFYHWSVCDKGKKENAKLKYALAYLVRDVQDPDGCLTGVATSCPNCKNARRFE